MPSKPTPDSVPVYLILGSGGQGRDVLDALLAAGRWVAGVFDDGTPPLPPDVPLLGELTDWTSWVTPGAELTEIAIAVATLVRVRQAHRPYGRLSLNPLPPPVH